MNVTCRLSCVRFASLTLCVGLAPVGLEAASPSPARADTDAVVHDARGDRFVAGRSIGVVQAVTGDLIAAGGAIDVAAPVGGDAVLAGNEVRLAGDVGQGVYAAGRRVDLDAQVVRNARVAGGTVTLGPNARIAGNLSAAGGDVRILGGTGGYVQISAGRATLNGPIGGDAEVFAGTVTLGPNARIGGRLRVGAETMLERDPAAQIVGGIERTGWPEGSGFRSQGRFGGGWAWSIGLAALAALLAGALPGAARRIAATSRERWGRALLLGFVVLVGVPVAALALMFTLIGIPLALGTIAAFPGLLLVGYVSTGVALGVVAVERLAPALAARPGAVAVAAAVGMLTISLLGRLPAIGGLVVVLAMLLGIGLIGWAAYGARLAPTPVVS